MKNGGPLPFGRTAQAGALPPLPTPSTSRHHLERRSFEFDRRLVVHGLDALTAGIGRAAIDLELVAAEGVFDEPVSLELLREARRLRSMTRELKKLRRTVVQVENYPRSPKGP